MFQESRWRCIQGANVGGIAESYRSEERQKGGGFHQANEDLGGLLEGGLLVAFLSGAEVGLGG